MYYTKYSWVRKYGRKGKAILVRAWTGPEDFRRLRSLGFETIGKHRW
jgi:hypothetical protein